MKQLGRDEFMNWSFISHIGHSYRSHTLYLNHETVRPWWVYEWPRSHTLYL